jgi:CheY-like chemotaxis protein
MAQTRQKPRRILLVEDCFSTREQVSMILGCLGYLVSTACNGEEALEKLRSHERPDLILLDLVMPVMDGWTFRQQLEREPEWAAIPVVILSGAGEEQTAAWQGALFLQKPVETADLLRAVQGRCGGECRCGEARRAAAVPH